MLDPSQLKQPSNPLKKGMLKVFIKLIWIEETVKVL